MKTTYSEIIAEYQKVITQDEAIMKSITASGSTRIMKSGETFRIAKGEIILLLEGLLAINMQESSSAENEHTPAAHDTFFRVGKGVRGMILGLVESFGSAITLQYVVRHDARIVTLPYDVFEEIFIQKDKFNYLIKMTAFTLSMLLDSYNERNFSNRYSVIRSMIYRYKVQKDAGLLHGDSLAGFILKRTKISRSYLFQILADLKDGGYIDVRNGNLASILKELPEKY